MAGRCPEPPSNSTSSSRTTFTTCCPGVSDLRTSWPMAFSRTRSTKPLTTLKLTSASRRARRTSRRASRTFSSVNRPNPRSRSKIPVRRLVRLSSMVLQTSEDTGCKGEKSSLVRYFRGTSQSPERLRGVRGLEDRRAGNQDLGPGFGQITGIADLYSSVHGALDSPAREQLPELPHLRIGRGEEELAAEARVDGHGQHEVKVVEHVLEHTRGRRGVERDPRLGTGLP